MDFDARKLTIAKIFVTEKGEFGATYYGLVAEQGGVSEGNSMFMSPTLEGAVEYLGGMLNHPKTGESFYKDKSVKFFAKEDNKLEE